MDFISNFINAMSQDGIVTNDQIIPDGCLHRFHVENDSSGTFNGWYVLYGDLFPAGAYGCWRRGISKTWSSRRQEDVSASEWEKHLIRINAIKEKHAKAKAEAHASAKERANEIWAESKPANHHDYLIKKKVCAYNLRESKNGSLIIPIYNINDELCSLQFIAPNGRKMFLRDGTLKGCYFLIGKLSEKLYIAEGYATAATINMVTNCGTIVSFNSGNLIHVAKLIRQKYPEKEITIAGDDDCYTDGNPGRSKAEEAAKAIGCQVIFPDFTRHDISAKPTDWNDLFCLAGNDELKKQLNTVLNLSNDSFIFDLANLSDLEYQRQRKEIAKKNNISVTFLDKLVKKEQKQIIAASDAIFPVVEPWPQCVDVGLLLNDIENILNKILVFPSLHESRAIVLWVIHTYCIDASNVSPILNINSPEKRCGKSTLMSVLQRFVSKPLMASNITPAALFRSIEKWQPCLMIDEADTFMRDNEELRGVINSGHTRELAYTLRCVGDNHEPARFCTWSAKVIAGIGHLAETIEDRSIVIQLRRKLSNEKREKLRDIPLNFFHQISQKCVRFAVDNIDILKNISPSIPASLNDRAADNWFPLLAIAQLAGDKWFKQASEAAIHLSAGKEEALSVGVELLQDIKDIFESKKIDRLYTHELLDALYSEDEAPWSTYNRGKPLSARQLGSKLREFKITSKDMRLPPDKKNQKGYCSEDFKEAFSRYLPLVPPKNNVLSATALQSCADAGSEVFSLRDKKPLSRIENGSQSYSHAGCSVVADKSTEIQGVRENKILESGIVCNKCGYRSLFCSCKN